VQNEIFKEAVGKFPTGITVISTTYGDKLWGFTANSFTSVSLSPSLISFCLNKEAGSFEAFKATDNFGISILSANQADISRHFATHIEDKFTDINHKIGAVYGAPLISGAVAFIECEKYNAFECGDHFIFVGKAVATKVDRAKSPLLYFAKSYLNIKQD